MTDVQTRDRIVSAAIDTIRSKGHSGSTARAIAAAGGFNQALIYYYFNDLDDLFLAALDHTSALRMSVYLERLAAASTPADLVRVARELFDEDASAGHITVLTELMATALGNPEFGRRIAERTETWIRLAQSTIERFVKGTLLEPMVQARPLAESIVAMYLGMEMMVHLDGNRDRAKVLFEMSAAALPFLFSLMGGA